MWESLREWFGAVYWSRTASATPAELLILQKLVRSQAVGGSKLFDQVRRAPYVDRLLAGTNGYRLTVPYVVDPTLIVDVRANATSPVLRCETVPGNVVAEFSATVLAAGFFGHLDVAFPCGQKCPRYWDLSPSGRRALEGERVVDWIEDASSENEWRAAAARLATWIGRSVVDLEVLGRERLRFSAAASATDLAECEGRAAMSLPKEYREFLIISNGMSVWAPQPLLINGTADLTVINSRALGERVWVVTHMPGMGVVVMEGGGRSESRTIFLSENELVSEVVGGVREYIVDTVVQAIERV